MMRVCRAILAVSEQRCEELSEDGLYFDAGEIAFNEYSELGNRELADIAAVSALDLAIRMYVMCTIWEFAGAVFHWLWIRSRRGVLRAKTFTFAEMWVCFALARRDVALFVLHERAGGVSTEEEEDEFSLRGKTQGNKLHVN